MTKTEAFNKMLEYSSSLNNCCCHIGKCIQTDKCEFEGYEANGCGFYDAFKTIRDLITVVRCKDCVYCSSLFTICTYNGRCEPVNADDFCSMGERK